MALYNVKHNDSETVLEVQLAGLSKDEISVQIVRDTLEVKATPTTVDDDYEYITKWFDKKQVDLKWELPNYISTKAIKVVHERGVLKITLPYKKDSYKEIEIE